ncbi:hypothetical protein ElyMa_000711600 [Elysia marginata]|uniref:Uncharacterized protein n=1 Tax=Elysia marginata TaxID=1093978 RepID=A0AAV4GM20_9GAST|nr:hypothetical protein ElyMa_000711600 [Elysia marginata]
MTFQFFTCISLKKNDTGRRLVKGPRHNSVHQARGDKFAAWCHPTFNAQEGEETKKQGSKRSITNNLTSPESLEKRRSLEKFFMEIRYMLLYSRRLCIVKQATPAMPVDAHLVEALQHT